LGYYTLPPPPSKKNSSSDSAASTEQDIAKGKAQQNNQNNLTYYTRSLDASKNNNFKHNNLYLGQICPKNKLYNLIITIKECPMKLKALS
jgi:hypothetical protein